MANKQRTGSHILGKVRKNIYRFEVYFAIHGQDEGVTLTSKKHTGYGETEALALEEIEMLIKSRLYGQLSHIYKRQRVRKIMVYDTSINQSRINGLVWMFPSENIFIDKDGQTFRHQITGEKVEHTREIVIPRHQVREIVQAPPQVAPATKQPTEEPIKDSHALFLKMWHKHFQDSMDFYYFRSLSELRSGDYLIKGASTASLDVVPGGSTITMRMVVKKELPDYIRKALRSTAEKAKIILIEEVRDED